MFISQVRYHKVAIKKEKRITVEIPRRLQATESETRNSSKAHVLKHLYTNAQSLMNK